MKFSATICDATVKAFAPSISLGVLASGKCYALGRKKMVKEVLVGL